MLRTCWIGTSWGGGDKSEMSSKLSAIKKISPEAILAVLTLLCESTAQYPTYLN